MLFIKEVRETRVQEGTGKESRQEEVILPALFSLKARGPNPRAFLFFTNYPIMCCVPAAFLRTQTSSSEI
ncbi:MAG: hypothetical protein HQL20_10810 [Candidatus Omnitrophica bacterium]|nr:hypothetical protein [Candidatus Omnitrophota bacterium]